MKPMVRGTVLRICLTLCLFSGSIMKSTKVQSPRRNKCSAVVEKNCLVAEYCVLWKIEVVCYGRPNVTEYCVFEHVRESRNFAITA